MIDIHCHILPGVDDGARTEEDSLAMARAAVDEGIRTVIATPHHANGKYINEFETVKQAVSALNGSLQVNGIPLRVLCGQEIRVYGELVEDLAEGRSATLNGSRYLLLEFPTGRIPSGIHDLLHELRVQGITPILAHPERNAELNRDTRKLYELVAEGMLCQLTSHSVNGMFGRKLQKLCLDWLRHNLAHFVSSDAHHVSHRPFHLGRAYQFIDSELGADLSPWLRENAEAVAMNGEIAVRQPIRTERKWYRLWKL